MKKQNFEIAVSQSHIDWTGRKVTGSHFGTIAIKEGTLTADDGILTGDALNKDPHLTHVVYRK